MRVRYDQSEANLEFDNNKTHEHKARTTTHSQDKSVRAFMCLVFYVMILRNEKTDREKTASCCANKQA